MADRLDSRAGWLVAVGAAGSMFAVFGVLYSFGAFFESIADDFGTSSGTTALVFGITTSLSFFLAPVAGRWADRAGPAPVLRAGAASLAVGLVATTLAPTIWLAYLSYGLGVGWAVACGYVPMVATVGGWFEKQRTAAIGVAVAGIGLGTLVGSPVAAAMIEATSWRTTFLLAAALGTTILLGVSTIARTGPAAVPTATPRSLTELVRSAPFRLLYGSALLAALALFVPFVFLATYAEERGVSSVAAATLVGCIGGSSVIGRLGLGALAAKVGAVRLYKLSFAVMGGSHLIWLLADGRFPLLIAYAITLGLGYGGFIALSPAVVAELFGLEGLGGVLGTLYTSAAIGALFGPAIAGFIIDGAGYETAIGAAMAASLAGAAVLLGLASSPPSEARSSP